MGRPKPHTAYQHIIAAPRFWSRATHFGTHAVRDVESPSNYFSTANFSQRNWKDANHFDWQLILQNKLWLVEFEAAEFELTAV